MQRVFSSFLFSFSLIVVGCLIPTTSSAQVSADGTTATTVNQDGNDFIIEQGDRAGDNLFHSFDQFSVPTQGSAAFNNAADIANIFSRVTGSNISNIDGLLSANGAANLYLINPNGIIFGENASLNLGGSFFASTADSLLFDGGAEFSVVDPQAVPLLEVSIPNGVSFRDDPGSIVNRSIVQNDAEEVIGLEVSPGKNISFVGGDINFEAGNATTRGGNITLGGLAEAGTVTINEKGGLNSPENITQADISFKNNSRISVIESLGGSITINGENLEIIEDSTLIAGVTPGSINSEAQAGNVNIDINNDIALSDSFIINAVQPNSTGNGGDVNITTSSLSLDNSQIATTTLEDGDGDSGNINISANSLTVNNGSFVNSTSLGNGNAGEIDIDAQNILFDNSFILSAVNDNAVGNGGDISISSSLLRFVNQSRFSSSNLGSAQGNAGEIDINAQDILFDNIILSSQGGENALANAGNLNITTKSLDVVNGTLISSSHLGDNDGGDITIVVEEDVRIAGVNDSPISAMGLNAPGTPTSVNSVIPFGSQGNGGDINISAGNLIIEDGAQVSTLNGGNGIGGDINLDIRGDILLQGRTLLQSDGLDTNFSSVIVTSAGAASFFGLEAENNGKAGNITIQSNSLLLQDNSSIGSGTGSNQNAGNITIRTEEVISLDSGVIDSSVLPGAEGNGGNIEIGTRVLNLSAGGRIDSQVNENFLDNPGGIGQGGNIRIDASDSVSISGFRSSSLQQVFFNPFDPTQIELIDLESSGIFVSTESGASGQAGTVTINTDELNLVDSGIIEAVTANSSNAGDIEINVNTLNAVDGGQIIATTFSDGKAGNIIINSNNAINLSGSDSTFGQRQAQSPDAFNNQGADSGIFSNTTINSTGTGGSIFISNPEQLTIQDDAEISVNSLGIGNGGDLSLQTNSLSLNQGEVSASTESGTGGNITLQVNQDLLLQNDSTISARAVSNADGGNVNVNSELVFAFPDGNNDIIANAQSGNGGNINITTESLFGIKDRPLNPFTNDINASSQLNIDGNIVINTPEVDPTSGLLELPEAVGNASDQISQNPCEQGVGSEFLVTGKGGFPANPQDNLNSDRVKVGLIEPVTSSQQAIEPNTDTESLASSEPVPAQGWVFNGDKVIFTAHAPNDTPAQSSERQYNTTCSSRFNP